MTRLSRSLPIRPVGLPVLPVYIRRCAHQDDQRCRKDPNRQSEQQRPLRHCPPLIVRPAAHNSCGPALREWRSVPMDGFFRGQRKEEADRTEEGRKRQECSGDLSNRERRVSLERFKHVCSLGPLPPICFPDDTLGRDIYRTGRRSGLGHSHPGKHIRRCSRTVVHAST